MHEYELVILCFSLQFTLLFTSCRKHERRKRQSKFIKYEHVTS